MQHVFKIYAISMHTCFKLCMQLVNGCIDDMLFTAVPDIWHALLQIIMLMSNRNDVCCTEKIVLLSKN